MNIIPNLPKESECYGCGACADICNTDAISMGKNEEGFVYPIVNQQLCVYCRSCEKVCPALHTENCSYPYIASYAGYNADSKEMFESTSGGFATALAEYIISNDGVVAGVVYNKDFRGAHYVFAENKLELKALQGSKYVESNKLGVYRRVQIELESRTVLFFGLPCQIAALKYYLDFNNKSTDNLITCELICAGTISEKVAEDYLSVLEKKNNSRIVYLNTRFKKTGWSVSYLYAKFKNGKTFAEQLFVTPYGLSIMLYLRKSCYHCKYRGDNGIGDLRIGDFWGANPKDEFWNPDGISLILARTEKGKNLVKKLANLHYKVFDVDYYNGIKNNISARKNKTEVEMERRETFSKLYREKGLEYAIRKMSPKSVLLKKMVPEPIRPMVKKVIHSFIDQ